MLFYQKTIFDREEFVKQWETIESLRELVKIHVDPNFKV